jgi:hypothetical protein
VLVLGAQRMNGRFAAVEFRDEMINKLQESGRPIPKHLLNARDPLAD